MAKKTYYLKGHKLEDKDFTDIMRNIDEHTNNGNLKEFKNLKDASGLKKIISDTRESLDSNAISTNKMEIKELANTKNSDLKDTSVSPYLLEDCPDCNFIYLNTNFTGGGAYQLVDNINTVFTNLEQQISDNSDEIESLTSAIAALGTGTAPIDNSSCCGLGTQFTALQMQYNQLLTQYNAVIDRLNVIENYVSTEHTIVFPAQTTASIMFAPGNFF